MTTGIGHYLGRPPGWLVSHDEDRHDRAIRIAANRVAKLIRGQRALFAGENAKAGARSADQAPA